jgi:uncharacterized protein (DUF952 family)
MALIYHITTEQDWRAAKRKGFYTSPSFETEGFIHTSEVQQVAGVLQRYYQGKTDLIKLVINTEKLTSELKYELAPSVNENFPHIYGPINLDAVIDVMELDKD